MTDPAAQAPAPPPPEAGPEAFFRRVLAENPFLDNRVNGPSAHDVDAEGVHRAAFERLVDLARAAHQARRGVGAVLWGEAGVGKSHLLSRLARWAGRDGHACLVYLHNLQAAPEHLPRSLLHAVVSTLAGGRGRHFAGTPLFRLARAGLRQAAGHLRGVHPWERLEAAHAAWLDRLGRHDLPGAALPDRTPHDVLFRFFRSAWRTRAGLEDGRAAALAVRWLSGQALDPDEARFLGLPPGVARDEPAALADNQQVKQVLVALTRLAAASGTPFVLAFDQVDNLDADQAAALARFLEALIDSSPNLLAVTAGIQATLLRWRESRVIQDSAWDRLAQFEVRLHRLTAAEAAEVVRLRLQRFLDPFRDLGPVRRRLEEDPLFPLSRAWHDRFLRDTVDVRPRDVINWAREGWRGQQEALRRDGGDAWLARWAGGLPGDDGPAWTDEQLRQAIDRVVGDKVAAHRARRQRQPEGLPPDAGHLAGLLHALLAQCRDAGHRHGVLEVERLPPPRRNARPSYDLAVVRRGPGGPPVRTGVLVLTADSSVSVAGFLRRLLDDSRPLDRLLLVTEERVGLPLGGRGRDYLDELRRRDGCRFRSVELTFPEYADLDALQAVVGLARAGDLEVEPRPGQARAVSPEEVVESHHRQGRYLSHRLLRELLAPASEPEPVAGPGTLVP